MKVVHDFFNWSKRLSLLEGKIFAVYNEVSRHQLIDVCRIRWIARIDALEVCESLYRAIILALEEVKDSKTLHETENRVLMQVVCFISVFRLSSSCL